MKKFQIAACGVSALAILTFAFTQLPNHALAGSFGGHTKKVAVAPTTQQDSTPQTVVNQQTPSQKVSSDTISAPTKKVVSKEASSNTPSQTVAPTKTVAKQTQPSTSTTSSKTTSVKTTSVKNVTSVASKASQSKQAAPAPVKSVVQTKPAPKVSQVSAQPKTTVVKTLKQKTVTKQSSTQTTTATPVKTTPVYTAKADWTLGIVPGIKASGKSTEPWAYSTSSPKLTMKALPFQNGSNKFPIEGKVLNGYRKDIEVEIVPLNASDKPINGELWRYALPVHKDGTFSGTVVIPFQSKNIDINIVMWNDDSTNLNLNYEASSWMQNNQPNLSPTQLAMLSSWMVNYNDSSSIRTKAQAIVSAAGAKGSYAEAKAIVNWVSQHIMYDFTTENEGKFFWQQASDALSRHIGVCQDESGLSAAMLRSLGVPTKVIMGGVVIGGQFYPRSHSWIEFYSQGHWVTADPTWDQVYTQGTKTALPSSTTYKYFDPNMTMFAKSHKDAQLFYW